MPKGGGRGGTCPPRFWQIRRRRRQAAAHRITVCPPRFLDLGTCLVCITLAIAEKLRGQYAGSWNVLISKTMAQSDSGYYFCAIPGSDIRLKCDIYTFTVFKSQPHCKYIQFSIVSTFHCNLAVQVTFFTIYSPM